MARLLLVFASDSFCGPRAVLWYICTAIQSSDSRNHLPFLVLSGNPLLDFANVRKIESRFKQGEFLTLGP